MARHILKPARTAPRKKAFARMLEICEREDPAYQVLHQNAVFTGMKSVAQVEGRAGLRHGLPSGKLVV